MDWLQVGYDFTPTCICNTKINFALQRRSTGTWWQRSSSRYGSCYRGGSTSDVSGGLGNTNRKGLLVECCRGYTGCYRRAFTNLRCAAGCQLSDEEHCRFIYPSSIVRWILFWKVRWYKQLCESHWQIAFFAVLDDYSFQFRAKISDEGAASPEDMPGKQSSVAVSRQTCLLMSLPCAGKLLMLVALVGNTIAEHASCNRQQVSRDASTSPMSFRLYSFLIGNWLTEVDWT